MRFGRWSWLAVLVQACLLSLLVSCGGGGAGESTEVIPPPAATPPVITGQPASQTVPSGSSATFTIEVHDAAGVAYQWLRNGAEVAGASQATYSLQNATAQDSGTLWSVRLTNAGGTVTSAQALLTVDPPPPVVVPPVVPLPIVVPPLAPPPPPSVAGISFMAGASWGNGSRDGSGRQAYFTYPVSIAADSAGIFYVTDSVTIRKVTADGTASTLAGLAGTTGEQDGAGSLARFSAARDLTVATDGFLYVLDGFAEGGSAKKLRRVSTDGSVTTVPSISQVDALAAAPNGGVYLAGRGAVYRWMPNGSLTLLAGLDGFFGTVDATGTEARFRRFGGMAVDTAGNIYVTQPESHTVRKITPAGVVTTFAGLASQIQSVDQNPSVDGIGAAARFNWPAGMAIDVGGNIWVVESPPTGPRTAVLRRISPAGEVTTPFGGDINRFLKNSYFGQHIAFGPSGDLYFTTSLGVDRITPSGNMFSVAGQDFVAGTPIGYVVALAVDPAGNTVAGIAKESAQLGLTRFAPDGARIGFGSGSDVSVHSALYSRVPYAQGIGIDTGGNIYFSDIEYEQYIIDTVAPTGGKISRVSPAGEITTVADWPAGSAGAMAPGFMVTSPDGAIYFVDLISGNLIKWTAGAGVSVLAGLGLPRQLIGLLLGFPVWSMAVDGAGAVYVLIQGAVHKLVNGALVVLAAGSNFVAPSSIVADAVGNVYVADREVIRKVSPDGTVTTLAGESNVIGLQAGALPGGLGVVGAMAIGADGTLRVMSGNALVKIRLQ
jgi:hypothetical protein